METCNCHILFLRDKFHFHLLFIGRPDAHLTVTQVFYGLNADSVGIYGKSCFPRPQSVPKSDANDSKWA